MPLPVRQLQFYSSMASIHPALSPASAETEEDTRVAAARAKLGAGCDVCMMPVDGTVDDLASILLTTKWFYSMIAGRSGFLSQGGSLLGVTTQLWAVKDRKGVERALCGLEFEARAQKKQLEAEAAAKDHCEGGEKHVESFTVELVWDSPDVCKAAQVFGYGAITQFDIGMEVDVLDGGVLKISRGDTRRADSTPAPLAEVEYDLAKEWGGGRES